MEPIAVANATTHGLDSLVNVSPLVTALVLAIIVLCIFIKILLGDAREERGLYRNSLDANTKALTVLQEVIRVAIK